MDLTKFPISSGSPSLLIGNVFSNSCTFSINSRVLSVLIGPGAMLMQLMFFWAYSLLNTLKTSANAARYAEDIINFEFGSLITLELIKKIYPSSLTLIFCRMVTNPRNSWLWYSFQSSSVTVKKGFGGGPPVFKTRMSVSLCFSKMELYGNKKPEHVFES